MSWPLSQDYNEAIQDPRGNFSDAELKAGEAVTNALGIPMPRSGNFADVYEVRCPSGARWAVKCFTREVHGLRERYAEISKYLRQVNLPFMVDFQYLEQGIRVRSEWYPILKMQWVEGFILNEFVRDNLDKKPILHALGQIWLRMARYLRKTQMAHCDLQHGNVLFVPGTSAKSLAVKLIDYDGMCVPSLAGKNSGELGHPAFQHPERLRTGAYSQEVDRFSLLSIATALRCLTVGGRALWERYDNGDNLLFRQADLQAPTESPLFQELLSIGDPQAQMLVTELYRACHGPLSDVPLLTDLLLEETPASKVTLVAAGQEAADQGMDWDFGDDDSDAPIVRKRRASSGMPLWLWGAIGGAAALLLSVGVGAGLFTLRNTTDKQGAPVVQTGPSTKSSSATQTQQSQTNSADASANTASVAGSRQTENLAGGIFCLSPTGDMLAVSGSGDNDWRLVDPRMNQLLRRFSGHTSPITCVAFSADGGRVVTGETDGMLRLWDVLSGEMIGYRPAREKPVVGVAFSPDGKKVLTVDGTPDARLWDFETNTPHAYRHSKSKTRITTSAVFTPDGRFMVFGFDKSDKAQDEMLVLWPLDRNIRGRAFIGPADTAVSCIAVSPDGKYIAAGQSGETHIVSLWEAATGRPIRQHSMPRGPIHQLVFSEDGRFLLATAANRYQIWSIQPAAKGGVGGTGGDVGTKDLVAAAFTPNGDGVTLAYRDSNGVPRIRTVGLPRIASSGISPASVMGQSLVWDKPVDPDRDCTFQTAGGKLTITVPGKDHDLGAERGQMNAPRLLFDVEGDFTAQVRVSGDFQPSTDATVRGKVPVVGAGLALLLDDKTYIRLERFGLYREPKYENFGSWELRQNARMTFSRTSPPLTGKETYLRMERRGDQLLGAVSEDGSKWYELKPIEVALPPKLKLGVDALSTSSRPFAPFFEEFQLKLGQGEMRRVDWPSIPAPKTIVEKPTPPPEEPSMWAHLDLPRDLVPDAKDPILRIPRGRTVATRQEYSGPLDITMVVRGPQDQDVSFIAPGGAMVTFRYNSRTGHSLNVRRPDNPSSEFGTEVAKVPIVLPPNKWCTLHWEIKSTGMMFSIDKRILFREAVRYDLTAEYPVKIRVNKATVEVKSVVVKSLKKQVGSAP
jgi:WD40 repeat protein/regulation of enolase protein 1 (concanavalin A-like superfamily)